MGYAGGLHAVYRVYCANGFTHLAPYGLWKCMGGGPQSRRQLAGTVCALLPQSRCDASDLYRLEVGYGIRDEPGYRHHWQMCKRVARIGAHMGWQKSHLMTSLGYMGTARCFGHKIGAVGIWTFCSCGRVAPFVFLLRSFSSYEIPFIHDMNLPPPLPFPFLL